MKNTTNTTTVVTLALNRDDAVWLKCLIQNPLSEPEDERDKAIRESFWKALSSIPFKA